MAVAEKVLDFRDSRSFWCCDFDFVSRTAVASRSAKEVFGFGGVCVGCLWGFFKETSLAFLPLSIPRSTR